MPQKEAYDRFGQLFRCRVKGCHDFYGYLLMKEAVAEDIENTKCEIHRLQEWLVALGPSKVTNQLP